jgi:hypothetical protein
LYHQYLLPTEGADDPSWGILNVIDRTLIYLREQLSDHIAAASQADIDADQSPVVFPNGQKPEPEFKLGAVTLLLAGVQHEPILRAADLHLSVGADGNAVRVRPTLRLQLMVLAAARHANYIESLRALSLIAAWGQAHPIIDRNTAPQLDPSIDRLTMEFVSLTIAEQNELWSSLGTGYLPSLMYRIRVLGFASATGQITQPVAQADRNLARHAG